jgi:cytochrome subunit of sulfide dehydrogenase
MRPVIAFAAFAVALTWGAAAQAQQAALPAGPVPGSVLAATCTGCHGPAGRSVAEIPPINGRTEQQLLSAMLDFKNDRRPATMMNRHAKGFSDDELAAIAREISANWR